MNGDTRLKALVLGRLPYQLKETKRYIHTILGFNTVDKCADINLGTPPSAWVVERWGLVVVHFINIDTGPGRDRNLAAIYNKCGIFEIPLIVITSPRHTVYDPNGRHITRKPPWYKVAYPNHLLKDLQELQSWLEEQKVEVSS